MKKKIPLKKAAVEEVEELDDEPIEDDEEGSQITPKLVRKFIRMWPRAIFTTPPELKGGRGKRPSIARTIQALDLPGVYILYRDDVPFYVGQTKGKLRSRLRAHANGVGSLRGYFWNYFSAFLVVTVSPEFAHYVSCRYSHFLSRELWLCTVRDDRRHCRN